MFAFDLISDLHIESWPEFDWSGKPTSPMCVLAGDAALHQVTLQETLAHLSECYGAVFYIDGNEEHKLNFDNIAENYRDISDITDNINDVIYMQDHVVITNGVAILATNGWWSWDFDAGIDREQCYQWFRNRYHADIHVPHVINRLAEIDANYLMTSVQRLQTHPDVKKIVIVTHTVPSHHLIAHDISLDGQYHVNVMGNSHMMKVLDADTERKISHWCFGHYHGKIDSVFRGVRFVNNCRGRSDSPWNQAAFQPLRIEVWT